jgi:adenylate kinase family enzyme
MQKVAVFGNAGGGKSTLSKRLSDITRLPLYALDKLQYQPGGAKVSDEEYRRSHQFMLNQDRWISAIGGSPLNIVSSSSRHEARNRFITCDRQNRFSNFLMNKGDFETDGL